MNKYAIESHIKASFENCAGLARDAYGDYIDNLVKSTMNKIEELLKENKMNEISEAQRGVINDYKLMIRRALDKNYDDLCDFGNIVIAMNELSAEITQFIVLESLGDLLDRKEKPKDPIYVKASEKLSWEKENGS